MSPLRTAVLGRLLLLCAALALATACSTLATVHGARTLEPGQTQWGMALSMQKGASPLSYAGFPVPQLELAYRRGLAPDVDFGARAYLLGTSADVRYRFLHQDRLHMAVDPTLAFFWLPGNGSVEVHAPVWAEYELTDAFSVSAGPRLILRDQFNSIRDDTLGKGAIARLDVFAGGGARVELHPKRFQVGLTGDFYGQPARHAGLSWSIGVDFGFRSMPKRKRRRSPDPGTDPADEVSGSAPGEPPPP